MKKFLCLFVFMFSLFSVHAQSQDTREGMQMLVQRIDSLEHELSYLKLTYAVNTLNSDIAVFANEVYAKSIAIRLDIYSRNFDSKLGDSYQQYYESCQHKKQSISELIEVRKISFTLSVMTHPYSENELDMLKASYGVVDHGYDALEGSMDLLKLTIDEYNKFL
ncbi:hypothetical protein [Bacteroides sp. ET225]|uniref:hypothetical protein n=1 Tax=Bacteroides sp. ET225 TaxID=2972461 RepID=UPI0021AC3DF7|nr:hypothetical protein [Bacteroides sp. ET225]MCR8917224.1 hypothetical protein [Bacteroides sp. ET225]